MPFFAESLWMCKEDNRLHQLWVIRPAGALAGHWLVCFQFRPGSSMRSQLQIVQHAHHDIALLQNFADKRVPCSLLHYPSPISCSKCFLQRIDRMFTGSLRKSESKEVAPGGNGEVLLAIHCIAHRRGMWRLAQVEMVQWMTSMSVDNLELLRIIPKCN